MRLVNLQAEAGNGLGLFENLHGFAFADTFARGLQDASKQVYGAPIRHFLQFVTASQNQVRTNSQMFRKIFIKRNIPEAASAEVSRAAGRFALVAAAGEIAIEAGILPWPEDSAIEASARLFKEWLAGRGTSGALDTEAAIRQVRLFLEQHGSARFERENETRPITARAGFYRRNGDGGEFWIMRETFKAEACRGFDAQAVANTLAECGHLVAGDGGRLVSRRRVGLDFQDQDNRMAVYVIREDILR